MILTCPECSARYAVEDGKIGSEGRTVRCARCGASWRATPDLPLEAPAPAAATAAEPDPAPAPAPSPAQAFRDKVKARRETVRAAGLGAVLAAVGVVLLALAAAAVVFREAVVAAAPPTAALFAGVGLPVNSTGLVFENQTAAWSTRDGRPVVVVGVSMRNIGERATAPAAVRVALVNGRNREVAVKVADAGGISIPPGGVRRFSLTFENPPSTAHDVTFALAGRAPPPANARSAEPANARLRATPAAPAAGAAHD